MLRWFRRTYPSYNLQPLLLKRYRELEEARAFNNWLGERRQGQEGHLDDVSRLTEAVHRQVPQLRYARAERRGVERAAGEGFNQRPRFEQVVGYLERNEPLPLDQPDRKATSFITSHFYLDASAGNSRGRLPHSRRPRTRTCALRRGTKGTAEPALLRMTWQETPRPAPATDRAALHHGPSAQHCRRRAGGSGPHRRRGSGTCSRAGFPQLPQDAAEYVRLNVLPRSGQAQPPPQIIGRPSDVERLLERQGSARRRWSVAQRRPWLRRRVRLPLPPRSLRVPGGPGRRGRCPGAHRGRGCWNAGCRGGSWCGGNGGAGRGHCGRRSLRPRAWHGLGAGEHALPAPAGQRGRGRAGRPVRQRHECLAAHRQQHVRQPRKQPRLLSVRLPCPSNTPRPFSWGLNPVLPQSQSLQASSTSGQSRRTASAQL